MVDREKQRARYLGNVEGAPPIPPPGGYRGARRVQPGSVGDPLAALPVAPIPVPPKTAAANTLGWAALIGAILFAVILLITLIGGGTGVIYGMTMLALQLILVGVIVAALCTRRGRVFAASALAVTLLVNVGTVGALSAVQTSAAGAYEGQKTEEQRHQEAYPGIKDLPESEILSKPSLEATRDKAEQALADIRAELSDRFGYTWTQVGDETLRNERNGFGGESLLVEFRSPVWATKEPIQDYDRKLEVMYVIEDVLTAHDLWGLYSFNEPTSGLDDAVREKFYGDTDPQQQTTWEWYSNSYPDPLLFYAMIHDLSNDKTGDFRAERESNRARTGEPLEGLQIFFLAPEMLSDADRAEFEDRISEY